MRRAVLTGSAAAVLLLPAPLRAGTLVEAVPARDPDHEVVDPALVGVRRSALIEAELTLARAVHRGLLPGAALAVGRRDRVVIERGLGRLDGSFAAPVIDPDRTLFDLASLTKVVATTAGVMVLFEQGKLRLDDPVARYLPGFTGGGRERITVRQLLTHTAGLPEGRDLFGPPPFAWAQLLSTEPVRPPGSTVRYSDVGFAILWKVLEAAAGESPYRLLDRYVFGPLGMRSTTFLPGAGCAFCAPTWWSHGGPVAGVVHDPMARALGGVSGHAGLFATLHDIARFAAMMANDGELDGRRIFRRETVRLFTTPQPGCGTRALGWDTRPPDGGGAVGVRMSPRAFGHTGFTGTSLWIDPETGLWVVLLSNRTLIGTASGQMQQLRRTVHDLITAGLEPWPTWARPLGRSPRAELPRAGDPAGLADSREP
jgi:CubicO group peptidase (beta-lactamase class C family)